MRVPGQRRRVGAAWRPVRPIRPGVAVGQHSQPFRIATHTPASWLGRFEAVGIAVEDIARPRLVYHAIIGFSPSTLAALLMRAPGLATPPQQGRAAIIHAPPLVSNSLCETKALGLDTVHPACLALAS
jgi:hypothetical protein